MIIKSLSRKSNTGQLVKYVLRYITKEEKTALKRADTKASPFIIRHNIRARTSVPNIIKEFQENETFRLYKRKDSVKLFHTIISFGDGDKEKVTDAILKDVAKKYIALRGKNSLYVGAKHVEDHIHIHLISSGTSLDGYSARISKQKFHQIKLALEAYQKERYPELIHSVVEHSPKKPKTKEAILQTIKAARQTTKESLLTSLHRLSANATSLDDFLTKLQEQGIEPYYRNGKLQGCKDGNTKFRFSRLGVDTEKLEALSQEKSAEDEALDELQVLRSGREKQQIKTVEPIVEQQPEVAVETEEAVELAELAAIRSNDRRRERSRSAVVEEIERVVEGSSDDQEQEDSTEIENTTQDAELVM